MPVVLRYLRCSTLFYVILRYSALFCLVLPRSMTSPPPSYQETAPQETPISAYQAYQGGYPTTQVPLFYPIFGPYYGIPVMPTTQPLGGYHQGKSRYIESGREEGEGKELQERRRRNAEAAAQFRKRRNQKNRELYQRVGQLEAQVKSLEGLIEEQKELVVRYKQLFKQQFDRIDHLNLGIPGPGKSGMF